LPATVLWVLWVCVLALPGGWGGKVDFVSSGRGLGVWATRSGEPRVPLGPGRNHVFFFFPRSWCGGNPGDGLVMAPVGEADGRGHRAAGVGGTEK